MVAVALLSAKGSPGVTTAALALSTAWPEVHANRRVLVAECDPAGGDIASGYLRGGLDGSRGLAALAAQRSTDPLAAVWEQVLALDDEGWRLLLPGLPDPRQAAGIGSAWSTLASALEGLGQQDPPIDVLLDLGRMRTMHEPAALRQQVDLVVLVTRSSLPAVVAARAAATELAAPAADGRPAMVTCLVVGEGRPYSATEISEAIALPVVGALPYDVASAAAFSSGAVGGRRLARSPLLRSARALAAALFEESGSTARALRLTDAPTVGAGRG
jgi:MinD-like ATPase involved in chromosome partitioning or flagellar assembly